MIKLVAMYKTPSDVEMFEKHYFEKHMPLVEKIPGLLKSEVSKLKDLPGTETRYYMMTEMYYDDMDSFNAAMASPEGKASARDLVNFAKDNVDFFLGKVK
ncbi:MAG TPA: EthD family reductase [Ignavibacteria bacterium]|nr:EthD family reductase [Ignavibacteria bacterium]HMQ99616.1 EthD family reductase [Ignavibacteria bacterium]